MNLDAALIDQAIWRATFLSAPSSWALVPILCVKRIGDPHRGIKNYKSGGKTEKDSW